MLNEVKKDNQKRGCLSFANWILILFDIPFVGCALLSVYFRITKGYSPNAIDYFLWAGAVVFLSLTIIVTKVRNRGASDSFIDPYFISIKLMTFDDLIEEVSKSFKMHRIENGWYSYGDAWFGSKVMCIFSNMYQYSEESLASLQDSLYERAWEDCGLKKRISMADAKNLIIIYVNTVDFDNDDLQKVIHKNAASTSGSFGNVFDAYVILSEGVVYIPRSISADFPSDAQYNNAVKFICDLFEELEDI